MKSNKKMLIEKWQDFLNAEGVPALATANKKAIVAKILDEQEKDLINSGLMTENWDELSEAEVSGNASSATQIAAGQNSGAVVYHGPTVMGIARRAIAQMMAFDTIGVQPLSQPTGQVFVLRATYGSDFTLGTSNRNEAFAPGVAPRVAHSGTATTGTFSNATSPDVFIQIGNGDGSPSQAAIAEGKYVKFQDSDTSAWRYFKVVKTGGFGVNAVDTAAEVYAAIAAGELLEVGEGIATGLAELMEGFNGSSNNAFNEMSFRIDKQGVEAKSRQLKAQYSIELAQDLRAVHGMDADTELQNILGSEILLEINREIVTLINLQAQTGASGKTALTSTTSPVSASGVFNMNDSSHVKGARWAGESYKALLIQIEKEANEVGRQTGRGNANWILASRNVVSALAMTDSFVSPAAQGLQSGLNTDTNTSVFAGVLGGRYKVFIDQYAYEDYFLVGYKGATEMEAGLYYSPYVALTPLRGQDPKNMQPVIAYKTRYGLSVNPFVAPEQTQVFTNSLARGLGANQYFRRVIVRNL